MNIAVITPIVHIPGIVERLHTKGTIFLLEHGDKDQVRQLLLSEDIDVILCNPNQQMYKIDKDLLDQTSVKLINTCSTGLNHIDVEYCKQNDITIYSLTTDYKLLEQLPSTAELAFGLMMSMLRCIPQSDLDVRLGNWDYTKFIGRQIKDLNIGIVGYGRLGKMMKRYCDAFQANTYIYDPYINDVPQTSLTEMFSICDVISLHVHVTPETKYMINSKLFGLSNKSLYIINTSRGEVVNEVDVIAALESGKLKGYATDVIEDEFDDIFKSPIIQGSLRGLNIITTPHIGGMTIEGQNTAYYYAIDKL
jgi:D-3-phosphoglycerate dehydrogenase / 2-oxoglutarate reductase